MKVWTVIVPFDGIPAADRSWRDWLRQHDISGLGEKDIVVDTGRGEHDGRVGSVRRYRIRTDKMQLVREKPESEES